MNRSESAFRQVMLRYGTLEYYNLTVDPDQNHNVIRQVMPARLAELKAMIDTAPACRGAAACLSALSPSPVPTG
jgi:hypothetical protein